MKKKENASDNVCRKIQNHQKIVIKMMRKITTVVQITKNSKWAAIQFQKITTLSQKMIQDRKIRLNLILQNKNYNKQI